MAANRKHLVEKRKVPKYIHIKKELGKRIEGMELGNNQLDTESTLAKEMGVSIATIRQAIDELIADGLVTRIQGKGIFGRPQVCTLPMRIDQDQNFRDMLSRNGYRVSVEQRVKGILTASENFSKRLPKLNGSSVYSYHWTFFADDTPAVIFRVEVPEDLVLNEFESNVPQFTLRHSLEELCGQKYIYTVAWSRAALDGDACKRFSIPTDTPLTVWDEVFYNLEDRHICYTEILFNPQIMDFSFVCYF